MKVFGHKTKKSILFWNTLAYVIFISVCVHDILIGCAISIIWSLVFLVNSAENYYFFEEPFKHYWIGITFLFWVYLLICFISYCVDKFNNMLDKEKEIIKHPDKKIWKIRQDKINKLLK